ncbi:hypothetical protein [Pantoea septica]|uniref:hypothetical protein n=1 Tax=Pantoea septica TaxID=472695 RepID=UPI003CFD7CC8
MSPAVRAMVGFFFHFQSKGKIFFICQVYAFLPPHRPVAFISAVERFCEKGL